MGDKSVIDIRKAYDGYQMHMYGNSTSHVRLTPSGLRGMPEYFEPRNFDTLDDGLKAEVCAIPFSQPRFLACILFIWALTCAAELKANLTKAYSFLYLMPTISSMNDVFARLDGEDSHVKVIV